MTGIAAVLCVVFVLTYIAVHAFLTNAHYRPDSYEPWRGENLS